MEKVSQLRGGDTGKPSSAQKIYSALREDILSLTLAPGEIVDEAGLAERFGVSRSPIREALIRLESDGLTRMTPNKGTIVTPLHLEEFPQYADALDTIQRVVTHLAAIQRTEEDLKVIVTENDRFKQAVEQRDAIKMIDANHAFHLAIGDAAHNRYFRHVYKRLLDEGRRTLRIYFRSFNDRPPEQNVSGHDKIIDAVRDRDAALAERLAHEHALQLSDRFLAYLGQRLTSGIGAKADT